MVAKNITFGWLDANGHLVGDPVNIKVDAPAEATRLQVLVGEWVVERGEYLDLKAIAEKLMGHDDTP